MRCLGVIPARWGSTRFPGKSLAPLCGKPLVEWVWERARQARQLTRVMVATDDERIARAVRDFGGDLVMTRFDHPSGTDRVAEAAASATEEIVVNVQGDEPLIDPALIDGLCSALAKEDHWDMATAATPIRDNNDLQSVSVVKVVFDRDGRALYFSRAPIPFRRDEPVGIKAEQPLHWRHIGIYAYRKEFLRKLVATPPCPWEEAEKLEQLRALYIGCRMKVVCADGGSGVAVDTPEDVPRAEAALRRAGLV